MSTIQDKFCRDIDVAQTESGWTYSAQGVTASWPHRNDAAAIEQFSMVNVPPQETPAVDPNPVPDSVTMRQARLALFGAGKLAAVDAAIASMPSPYKEAAQIEWEFSGEVRRRQPLVLQLGPALGLTTEQIDNLFRQAATL
jgi:hypothetical protein